MTTFKCVIIKHVSNSNLNYSYDFNRFKIDIIRIVYRDINNYNAFNGCIRISPIRNVFSLPVDLFFNPQTS